MKTPSLSIVVPVYNAAWCIEGLVGSVIAQDFTEFELILIDDGSTDNTPTVLDKLKKKDGRIRVIKQRNQGPSGARNTGLQKARGDYILFCDSDDMLSTKALSVFFKTASSEKSDLITSGWQIDLQTNHGIHKSYKKVMPAHRVVTGSQVEIKKHVVRSIGSMGELYNLWNKLFRADIIKQHKLRFREDLRFGEDLLFILSYIEYANSLVFIPDITYEYLSGSSTSTFSKSALSPEYRQINNDGLDTYVSPDSDRELDDLAAWVKWRWIFSYYLLVFAAKLPLREKWSRFKQLPTDRPPKITSAKYVGVKKYLIATVVSSFSRVPAVLFCFVACAHGAKRLVLYTKILRQRLIS